MSVGVPAAERSPARSALRDGSGARRVVESLSGDLRMLPVLLALALIWLAFYAAEPAFLSSRNLSNLSLQIVVTGVIALGLVLVLLVAEIDLSVAASSGVCATLMAILVVNRGMAPALAIALAVAFGALIGLIQAAVVVFGAPSFVVTLGGSLVLQGLLLAMLPNAGQVNLASTPVAEIAGTYIPASIGWLAALVAVLGFGAMRLTVYRHERQRGIPSDLARRVLLPTAAVAAAAAVAVAVLNGYQGVPVAVAIFLALLMALSYVTTQTRYGTNLYAVGGNRSAAGRAGIRVNRVIASTFVLAGAFAALAGVIAASRVLGVSSQSGGGTILLEAIAAAVIGGTSLFGGRGSVWAALFGALIIGSVSNGMDLLGLPTEAKLVVQGLILVAAITVDSVLARGSLRPRVTG